MKRIAALLTVYNRCDTTLRCLRELEKQKLPQGFIVDIYLTDDGCTDGTPQRVASEYPHVHIIKGNGNLYWNRGMLKAWEISANNQHYDYYLWLNDDTILIPDAVKILLDNSKKVNNKSIIVGATSDVKTHSIVTYSGYKGDKMRIIPNGKLQLCEYFNGNIVLIPQAVYSVVGMNNPSYSHSIGDFDYGLRAKKNGILYYVSTMIVGYCDRHNAIPIWCNSNYSLKKRWISFRSPLGAAPIEYFIFDYRHKGFIKASCRLITSFIKFIFPRAFNRKSKNDPMYFNKKINS